MYRKIHSNRDPKDTLSTELRKEFAAYFRRADQRLRSLCLAYPKQVYVAMVLLLILSIVLSFTLFRSGPVKPRVLLKANASGPPISDGFGQITRKATALQETIILKTQIEALIAKDSLNRQDSVVLEKAIDRFHQLSIQN